jgi:hypothetical protein
LTSEERREARYWGRRAKRDKRKGERNLLCGSFDDVFNFENLYDAFRKSRSGVLWKSSVQTYKANVLANVYKTYTDLMNRRYKSRGFVEFDLIERGKPRHIRSVHISERVVQRCLCDYCLVPLLRATFIYDNGASLSGKGIDFSKKRLSRHLREHYRENGTEGYVLVFDFSKYFDSAQHEPIFGQYERCITDPELLEQAKYFIRQFGSIGMGLGSQVSQISALALPNALDHYIKEVLRIKRYGRYMDDGYLIHRDKAYLHYCKDMIAKKCAELGIRLNVKKTQIIKLSHGFTFLKTRYSLTETGGVICRVNPKAVKKMRKKLCIFHKWVDCGKMTVQDVATSYQSWRGHARRCNSYKTLKSMDEYYNSLFQGGEQICITS